MSLINVDELMRDKVWFCGGFVGDDYTQGYMDALDKVEEVIREQPIVKAIPFDSEYIKQIRWERDIAISQLEDIGCGFGQDMTEVKEKLESSNKEFTRPRGEWFLLNHCSNAGVYCSNCYKKVFKKEMYYANVKIRSKFCPNCGAEMSNSIKKV